MNWFSRLINSPAEDLPRPVAPLQTKPLPTNQEFANRVFAAVDALNAAVNDARALGLVVNIRGGFPLGGRTDVSATIHDKRIEPTQYTRQTP